MTAVLHSRVAPVLELEQRSGSDPEEAGVLSLPPRCSTGVSCGTLTSHLLSTWRREQAAPFGAGAGPGGNGMSRRWRLALCSLSRDHGSDSGARRGAHEPGHPAGSRGLPRRAERGTATQVDGHHRLPGR